MNSENLSNLFYSYLHAEPEFDYVGSLYNSQFIIGQTRHFANKLESTFFISDLDERDTKVDNNNNTRSKRRNSNKNSSQRNENSSWDNRSCDGSVFSEIDTDGSNDYSSIIHPSACASTVEDVKHIDSLFLPNIIEQIANLSKKNESVFDICEIDTDDDECNTKSRSHINNENPNKRRKTSLDVCCCLCSMHVDIKLHKTTSHVCDRSSSSSITSESTCKSCLARLVACSKTIETVKKVECCFRKCKKLLQRGSLKGHYMSHFQMKKYKCPICDMGHSTKATLQKHQRKH